MRLEAMRKDFVANASHELRSPLTVVAGYLETFAADPSIGELSGPIAEMRRQTYREGWLPGYVFGMVRQRPGQDLFEPMVALDENRPARGKNTENTDVR